MNSQPTALVLDRTDNESAAQLSQAACNARRPSPNSITIFIHASWSCSNFRCTNKTAAVQHSYKQTLPTLSI